RLVHYRCDVAVKTDAEAVVPLAADCRRDAEPVAPDDGTRVPESRYRRRPADVLLRRHIPVDCRREAVRDTRAADAPERGPVHAGLGIAVRRGREGRNRKNTTDTHGR